MLLQKPGPAPGALSGPLLLARVDTGSCHQSHDGGGVECFAPKLEISKVNGRVVL